MTLTQYLQYLLFVLIQTSEPEPTANLELLSAELVVWGTDRSLKRKTARQCLLSEGFATTSNDGLTLTAAGLAFCEEQFGTTWLAACIERETEILIECLEMSTEPQTVEALIDADYEPLQKPVRLACLYWLIRHRVLLLTWDGRVLPRQFGSLEDEQPIDFELVAR